MNQLTEELEILIELSKAPRRSTPLFLSLIEKGVSIGVSCTNKIRLLHGKEYIYWTKDIDPITQKPYKEKTWHCSEKGKQYLSEILEPKLL